jgi:hypothetical protein
MSPGWAQTGATVDESRNYPVYVETMKVLQSPYAQKKFPPLKLAVAKPAQIVTDFETADQEFFRSLQFVKAMGGRIKAREVLTITNGMTANVSIGAEEALAVELLKTGTPFTLRFKPTESFKPNPLVVTPKPDAVGIERLQALQDKGIELESHMMMARVMLTREKFGEWFKLYQLSDRDRELALALIRRRFMMGAESSNYQNGYSPIRNTMVEIRGWMDVVPYTDRKNIKAAIYNDLVQTNAQLPIKVFQDFVNIMKP